MPLSNTSFITAMCPWTSSDAGHHLHQTTTPHRKDTLGFMAMGHSFPSTQLWQKIFGFSPGPSLPKPRIAQCLRFIRYGQCANTASRHGVSHQESQVASPTCCTSCIQNGKTGQQVRHIAQIMTCSSRCYSPAHLSVF